MIQPYYDLKRVYNLYARLRQEVYATDWVRGNPANPEAVLRKRLKSSTMSLCSRAAKELWCETIFLFF